MSRKKLRENLMKLVFQYNLTKNSECDFEVLDEEELTEEDKVFLESNYKDILNHYDEITQKIEKNLINFKLNRIAKTDLAILTVAIYELEFSKENQPFKVVINEAVELAKKYSDEKNYKFVNGLLAKVVNAI